MLCFKGMQNSIDFYKRIFLHIIPVCIIVPWFNTQTQVVNGSQTLQIYLESQMLNEKCYRAWKQI